jgi:hypothetical protein
MQESRPGFHAIKLKVGRGRKERSISRDLSLGSVPTGPILDTVSNGRISDADDHVWVLSRPHTLPHTQRAMAAPPVMEFDNAGNFIQGWGGESGPGYQWPSNEHAASALARS